MIQRHAGHDRLLGWDQVMEISGLSRSTLWRLQKRGDFPDPVRLAPRRLGWWESDLIVWAKSRKVRKLPCAISVEPPQSEAG